MERCQQRPFPISKLQAGAHSFSATTRPLAAADAPKYCPVQCASPVVSDSMRLTQASYYRRTRTHSKGGAKQVVSILSGALHNAAAESAHSTSMSALMHLGLHASSTCGLGHSGSSSSSISLCGADAGCQGELEANAAVRTRRVCAKRAQRGTPEGYATSQQQRGRSLGPKPRAHVAHAPHTTGSTLRCSPAARAPTPSRRRANQRRGPSACTGQTLG